MQYLNTDLGYRKRGEVVQVTLRGQQANVLLLDSSNFSSFKAGRTHRYHGGLAKRSPVSIPIPHSGHWYVVIHLGGLPGRINAGVQVLPGALPPLRQTSASPLASIRQAADEYADSAGDEAPAPEQKPYDVFVCHASADKDDLVRPLAHALRDENLAVWYDEFELKIGDSLPRKIDAGLIRSRFGVVVLSKAFFGQGWRRTELDGLVTMEAAGGRQLILPVWHNVTSEEVLGYSPTLAAKLARSTSEYSVKEIAEEIAEVART